MREIKFRAWDKEKCKMYNQKDILVYFDDIGEDVYTKDDIPRALYNYKLMQYTGLKDSNDVDIYEGDIVKIEDYFGEDMIGKIIYDKESASYIFHSGNEESYFQSSLDIINNHVCNVIGNIYENKDLLGGNE